MMEYIPLIIIFPIMIVIFFKSENQTFDVKKFFSIVMIVILLSSIPSMAFQPVSAINNIKQIIKIEDEYDADNAFQDYTISPPLTNVSKSFAFVTFSHTGEADHSDTFRSWEIIDESTLRIKGENTASGNNALEFIAYVVEYEGDIQVQQLLRTTVADETEGEKSNTIPNAVNTTNSFIISQGHHHNASETTIGSEELDRIRIIDSTNWGWLVADTPNSGDQGNPVSIIDWNQDDIFVQRGLVTLSEPSLTTTVSPPTDIDRTRTMLLVTYTCGGSCELDNSSDEMMLRATLDTSSPPDIVFERDDTDDDLLIAWELIEFPEDFARVHHDVLTISGGSTTEDDSIPEVRDFDKSFVISTVGTPFGWGGGEQTDGSGTGAIDRGMVDIGLVNEDLVHAERGDSTGDAIINYQVVELLETEHPENPHSQSILKQIIKFEGTFDAGNVFQDYTIPNIENLNKTVIFMTMNSTTSAGSSESGKMWRILNANTLRIFGSGTAINDPADFLINILEFNGTSSLFTQYDQLQYSEDLFDGNRTMWVSPVNLTSSFILGQGSIMESGDPTFGSEEFASVTLENETRWMYETDLAQDSVETVFESMIVDTNNDNIRVQRGSGIMNSTTTTVTVVPPISIDREQTFLLVNFRTEGGEFAEFPNRTGISATIDGSNNIVLERYSGGVEIQFNWQLVENLIGAYNVYHDVHHQDQGQFNETSTIPAVINASNTFAIGTVSSYFTQTLGRGNSSEPDFDTIFGKMKLENETTVRFTRGDSSASWDVGFQVMEFFFTQQGVTSFVDIEDTVSTVDFETSFNVTSTDEDTVTILETVLTNVTTMFIVTLNDTGIVTDVVSLNMTKLVEDSILTADDTGINMTKLVSDVTTVSDDTVLLRTTDIGILDSLNSTDLVILNVTRQITDVATVTDTVDITTIRNIILNDTVSVNDPSVFLTVHSVVPAGSGTPSSDGGGIPSFQRIVGLSITSERFHVAPADRVPSDFIIQTFGLQSSDISITNIEPDQQFREWFEFSQLPQELVFDTEVDNTRVVSDPARYKNTALDDFVLDVPKFKCEELDPFATPVPCIDPVVYEAPLTFTFTKGGVEFREKHIVTIDASTPVQPCDLVCQIIEYANENWWWLAGALIIIMLISIIGTSAVKRRGLRTVRRVSPKHFESFSGEKPSVKFKKGKRR